MDYSKLSLVELARHYADFHDVKAMEELRVRDCFANECVFTESSYEAGRRAGFKQGLKEIFSESIDNEESRT